MDFISRQGKHKANIKLQSSRGRRWWKGWTGTAHLGAPLSLFNSRRLITCEGMRWRSLFLCNERKFCVLPADQRERGHPCGGQLTGRLTQLPPLLCSLLHWVSLRHACWSLFLPGREPALNPNVFTTY